MLDHLKLAVGGAWFGAAIMEACRGDQPAQWLASGVGAIAALIWSLSDESGEQEPGGIRQGDGGSEAILKRIDPG